MKKSAHKSTSRSNGKGRTMAGNGARSGKGARGDGHRNGSEPSAEWLKDFLSEMLAVERGGVKFYEKALSELSHEELRDRLEEFLEETRRHVELCEEMVGAAGGDPDDEPGRRSG